MLSFANKPWKIRDVEKRDSKELKIVVGVNALGWVAVSGIS